MSATTKDPLSLQEIARLQRDGLVLLGYLAEKPNRAMTDAPPDTNGIDPQLMIAPIAEIAGDPTKFNALVRSVDLLGRAAAPATASSVRLTWAFLLGRGPEVLGPEQQRAKRLRLWMHVVRIGLLIAAAIAISLLLKADQGRRIVGQLAQVRGELDRTYAELWKLDRERDFEIRRYEKGTEPVLVPANAPAAPERPTLSAMEECWPLEPPTGTEYRLLPIKPQSQNLCSQLYQLKLREQLIYARIQTWNCDMVRLNPLNWARSAVLTWRRSPIGVCNLPPLGLDSKVAQRLDDWKRTELRTNEVIQGLSGYLLPLLLGGIGGGVYVVRRMDEVLRTATLSANDGISSIGRIVLAATFGGLLAMVFSTDEPVKLGSFSLTIAAWAFFLGYALETVLKTLDAAIEGVVGKLRPGEGDKKTVPMAPPP
jgi:hypothetical protein